MLAIVATIPAQFLLLGAYAGLLFACRQPAPPVRPPPSPQCVRIFPVRLVLDPSTLATENTPRELTVPTPIVESVSRTGKSRLHYAVSICSGSPPIISTVEHSTGFAELDRFLDTRIPDLDLDLPSSGCTIATFVLPNFDAACEPAKAAN